jgi:hypothetical protein
MVLAFTLKEEAMTFADYLLELFYLIDSLMETDNLSNLRQRGPAPRLSDSEVITIELAGEFLGIDADKKIWQHFRRYHLGEFPQLAHVDRSRFARQAADLWHVKRLLQRRIFELLPAADPAEGRILWLIDSFPLRVCRIKRAAGAKLFGGQAAFGYDPTSMKDPFFGFRVHLLACDRGFCAGLELAPANVPDLPMAAELAPAEGGEGLGDRNYWGPDRQQAMQEKGFKLHAPFRKESSDPWPGRSKLLSRLRQIIEPVIGQLAVRFNCQRTWARDLWHLCSRLSRKILSHTTAVLLNGRQGNPPLQLELLIRD